jgi:hypothetical protein
MDLLPPVTHKVGFALELWGPPEPS